MLRQSFIKYLFTENLARKNDTVLTQSSTYSKNNATLANDGYNGTTELNCSHTAPGYDKAWFQVDLRNPYTVESVTIYFRREGNYLLYNELAHSRVSACTLNNKTNLS